MGICHIFCNFLRFSALFRNIPINLPIFIVEMLIIFYFYFYIQNSIKILNHGQKFEKDSMKNGPVIVSAVWSMPN